MDTITPTTTVREATCVQCQRREPSKPDLAFFEDRTPGSRWAKQRCKVCAYAPRAHEPEVAAKPHLRGITEHTFVEHPGMQTDAYYCGCRGWD